MHGRVNGGDLGEVVLVRPLGVAKWGGHGTIPY